MASAWLKDSKVGPFFLFLFFAPSLYRSFKEMNWNAAEGNGVGDMNSGFKNNINKAEVPRDLG